MAESAKKLRRFEVQKLRGTRFEAVPDFASNLQPPTSNSLFLQPPTFIA